MIKKAISFDVRWLMETAILTDVGLETACQTTQQVQSLCLHLQLGIQLLYVLASPKTGRWEPHDKHMLAK